MHGAGPTAADTLRVCVCVVAKQRVCACAAGTAVAGRPPPPARGPTLGEHGDGGADQGDRATAVTPSAGRVERQRRCIAEDGRSGSSRAYCMRAGLLRRYSKFKPPFFNSADDWQAQIMTNGAVARSERTSAKGTIDRAEHHAPSWMTNLSFTNPLIQRSLSSLYAFVQRRRPPARQKQSWWTQSTRNVRKDWRTQEPPPPLCVGLTHLPPAAPRPPSTKRALPGRCSPLGAPPLQLPGQSAMVLRLRPPRTHRCTTQNARGGHGAAVACRSPRWCWPPSAPRGRRPAMHTPEERRARRVRRPRLWPSPPPPPQWPPRRRPWPSRRRCRPPPPRLPRRDGPSPPTAPFLLSSQPSPAPLGRRSLSNDTSTGVAVTAP